MGASAVERVFTGQADRLGNAWRQAMRALHHRPQPALLLLDGVVEPLVAELGRTLGGAEGHPWTRCRGLLRLSSQRGTQGLHDEFTTLRRCLAEAIEVLGGTSIERAWVTAALEDAAEAAAALHHRLERRTAAAPRVMFGGLVVELFETRPRSVVPVRLPLDPAQLM